MWSGAARAHDGAMFTSYDLTKALAAERQTELRLAADDVRLMRRLRHRRRDHHRRIPDAAA
jgi:hypothetical protein